VRGVYATSALRAIVDLLQREKRYLSAAAIFRSLRSAAAPVALSTVYRTLERLVVLGTVSSRTDQSGEATYVFCGERHHHHAICRVCGHVDDVDCEAMDVFRLTLSAQKSFDLDDHAIEFFGRCARCR
jgi:Fur family ferric uptake transcriptional regulator